MSPAADKHAASTQRVRVYVWVRVFWVYVFRCTFIYEYMKTHNLAPIQQLSKALQALPRWSISNTNRTTSYTTVKYDSLNVTSI